MTLLLIVLTLALAAEDLLFHFVIRPKRGAFLRGGKQNDNTAAVALLSGLSVLAGYLLAFLLTGGCALLPSAGFALLLSGGGFAIAKFVLKSESGIFLAAAPVNALLTMLMNASRITAETLEDAAIGGSGRRSRLRADGNGLRFPAEQAVLPARTRGQKSGRTDCRNRSSAVIGLFRILAVMPLPTRTAHRERTSSGACFNLLTQPLTQHQNQMMQIPSCGKHPLQWFRRRRRHGSCRFGRCGRFPRRRLPAGQAQPVRDGRSCYPRRRK